MVTGMEGGMTNVALSMAEGGISPLGVTLAMPPDMQGHHLLYIAPKVFNGQQY